MILHGIWSVWFFFFLMSKARKISEKKSERNSCLAFCENIARKHEELTVPVLFG